MRIAHAVATAAVAGAVIVAGCGSSAKKSTAPARSVASGTATFNTDFKRVTGELKQTSQAIGAAIQGANSKTDAQLAATFGQLATRWSGQSGQLSALTPPASVAAEFSTLTAAADRTGTDLEAISGAVGKHSAAPARQATINLLHDILAAKAEATKIDSRLRIS